MKFFLCYRKINSKNNQDILMQESPGILSVKKCFVSIYAKNKCQKHATKSKTKFIIKWFLHTWHVSTFKIILKVSEDKARLSIIPQTIKGVFLKYPEFNGIFP